jgi:hypothetical protein
MIESIFKETNIGSIKKFNDQWKKFLTASGDESITEIKEILVK